nr:hypothetical protein [Tanacetum cinerariifolium]
DVFETALPPRPVADGDAPVDPQALAEWTAKYDRHNEGDETSVGDHFLLMKSYLDQLASLSYTFDDKIAIGFILESLTSDFHGFVQNYNMQSMGKTLSEVHQMLIEYEKGINKNKQLTVGAFSSIPQVMEIQGGRVQKKPHGKAKGKGKAK